MNIRWRSSILLTLACLLLAACTLPTPTAIPTGVVLPTDTPAGETPVPPTAEGAAVPEQIILSDGEKEITLTPGDDAFVPIARDLAALVSLLDARARTFYTAERFEEEIASGPHLDADYGGDKDLAGRDIRVYAGRVVIAAPSGDPIALSQSEVEQAEGRWSVYLTSQTAPFEALFATVQEQTGINLIP